MPVGGTLAFTTIIIAVSAGIIIRHRRGDGWRRIVAVAVLVWLAVAGLIVLWALIAAVAGQRAYFGAVQVPLAAHNDAAVGITLGVTRGTNSSEGRDPVPALVSCLHVRRYDVGVPVAGVAASCSPSPKSSVFCQSSASLPSSMRKMSIPV
jgi:hypothetical protein